MIPYILEVVTYKERRIIMYADIKKFFTDLEPGLGDAFYWIEKLFPKIVNY